MSKGFKITLATISLIISIPIFLIYSFAALVPDFMSFSASSTPIQIIPLLLYLIGEVSIIYSYIMVIKNNKNIFFWISMIPMFMLLIYALSYFNIGNFTVRDLKIKWW